MFACSHEGTRVMCVRCFNVIRPFLSKLLQSAQDDNEAASIVPLGCPLKVAGQHLISTLRSHSKSVTCVALKV